MPIRAAKWFKTTKVYGFTPPLAGGEYRSSGAPSIWSRCASWRASRINSAT